MSTTTSASSRRSNDAASSAAADARARAAAEQMARARQAAAQAQQRLQQAQVASQHGDPASAAQLANAASALAKQATAIAAAAVSSIPSARAAAELQRGMLAVLEGSQRLLASGTDGLDASVAGPTPTGPAQQAPTPPAQTIGGAAVTGTYGQAPGQTAGTYGYVPSVNVSTMPQGVGIENFGYLTAFAAQHQNADGSYAGQWSAHFNDQGGAYYRFTAPNGDYRETSVIPQSTALAPATTPPPAAQPTPQQPPAPVEQAPGIAPPVAVAPAPGAVTTVEAANQSFISQWGPTAWNSAGHPYGFEDCGPTSVAMALSQLGLIAHPGPAQAEATIDAMRDAAFGHDTSQSRGTGNGQLARALEANGAVTQAVASNQAAINAALDAGHPVIVGSNTTWPAWGKEQCLKGDYLNGRNPGGHFVTVMGRSAEGNYLVADPLSKVGTIEVTPAQLQRALDGASLGCIEISSPAQAATSAPAPTQTPGPVAAGGAGPQTALQQLLAQSPSIRTNQELLNSFFRAAGNDWSRASIAAASLGASLDELAKDRTGLATDYAAKVAPRAPVQGPLPVQSQPGQVTATGAARAAYDDYAAKLAQGVQITRAAQAEVTRVMGLVSERLPLIDQIARQADLPAEVVAAIWYRENSGMPTDVYLHNGQKLGAPTTAVPVGVFFRADQFLEASADALASQATAAHQLGLHYGSRDFAAMAAFTEGYNGFGYRNQRHDSAYVLSGSQFYRGGLYVADHVYSQTAMDRRPGTLVLMMEMARRFGAP